jgi:hypothetical protein
MSYLFEGLFKASPYGGNIANDPRAIASWDPALFQYGQTIKWGAESISVSGCKTSYEAISQAVRMAEKSGWTNPRWWQFWGIGETRFDRSELARLKAKYEKD